jgi:hypothetical protein
MISTFVILAALIAAAAIGRRYIGFAAQRPEDYAALAPRFDVKTHLAGPILCEGVIYGPLGRISSRFVAQMHGTWSGNTGILSETFQYDSGAEQLREWRLTILENGMLRAEANDLVGPGQGMVSGPAVQMLYRLRLPAAAGGHVLNVTDWMYLAPNGTIINRSQFRKFGIKVAELVATMRPIPPNEKA